MSELVECSECATHYDSQEHPFCPRCGSTAQRGAMPGALASARRNDPARRRVQASGAVLLAIGALFLFGSVAAALVPEQRAAESLVDSMAAQPGGTLVIQWPETSNATLRLALRNGTVFEDRTVEGGRLEVELDRAVVQVTSLQGDAAWNQTAVVLDTDRLVLVLAPGGESDATGPVTFSPLVLDVLPWARYVSLAVTLVLCVGGLCALLLRAWPIAAVAAIMGMIVGLFALAIFLLLGLLFAIPFAICGILILRGRKQFRTGQG